MATGDSKGGPNSETNSALGAGSPGFMTTRWSRVIRAAGEGTTETGTAAALEELCRAYRYPLYVYVRRRGYDSHDAEDLTQGFFEHLLAKGSLRAADPRRGRFRTFLLTSLRNYVANQWDRGQARKRGGGQTPVDLDAGTAETRYRNEPPDPRGTPEDAYTRRWALDLLDAVLARLRDEYNEGGREELFSRLKPFLTFGDGMAPYAAVGAELGLTEGAVKVAVHRLRRRYRDLLRDEIAQTVCTPDEVDDELRVLMAVFSR